MLVHRRVDLRDAEPVQRGALAILGSVAAHGLLLIGLRIAPDARPPAPAPSPIEIALVTPDPPARPPPPVVAAASAGGSPRPTAARRARVQAEGPRVAATITGTVAIDRDGGRGRGGFGGGDGDGIGAGHGSGVAALAALTELPLPPPPPAPRISRARPARLIYPSREVAIDETELFVVRLTVDPDGMVAGATLARGFGGTRDDAAVAAAFRFRYDPARDDDGRAIRSTVDQHFHLGR